MRRLSAIAVALVLTFCGVVRDCGASCRLYVAGQYSWGARRGFYIDFEGADLANLPLIIGVADGEQWTFGRITPDWEAGREYQIKAVVRRDTATLWLDDAHVTVEIGGWEPYADKPLEVNWRPSWTTEVGDWAAVLTGAEAILEREGETVKRVEFEFPGADERPVPVILFEDGFPQRADLPTTAGDAVRINVTLKLIKRDLDNWAPFIDRYGQSRHAQWAGKVRSDEELVADIAREDARLAEMPASEEFDAYGGLRTAPWHGEATGFFRIVQRDGQWWLVSPEGNPCFYTGVSNVPAQTWPKTPISGRELLFEWLPEDTQAWPGARVTNQWGIVDGTEYVTLYACNLVRKYGLDEWRENATERALRRLRSWGFSGGGKWGCPRDIVSTPVLRRGGVPNIAMHPDVFDPDVRERFRAVLEEQIAPRKGDPNVLGWSLGNEYDEIITPDEVSEMLGKGADVPAKRALVDYAIETMYEGSAGRVADAWDVEGDSAGDLYEAEPSPPAADIEKLRCFFADRYYEFIYTTVKDIDPNHLYFGFWIVPGWWENEQDWHIIARHCDVIGYDRYAEEYADERLRRLQEQSGKPTLRGEYCFPPWYAGRRGFGQYKAWVPDSDAEAGDMYYECLEEAARDPYCVGMIWFLYRDQPLTGRGPGHGKKLVIGEHYAFGLVTLTDRPKWPLVERIREANLGAANWRLSAASPVNDPNNGGNTIMPKIEKLGTVQDYLVETSPFVYDGQLVILESVRPRTPDNTHGGRHYLRIRQLGDGTRDARDAQEFQEGPVLCEFGEGFTFAAPFVRDGQVFVYASRGEKKGETDDIHVFRSDDMETWEESVAIVGEAERLYNCSVCEGEGRYVMCYETGDSSYPAFTIKFAESDDLVNWRKIPTDEAIYGTDRYTACPTIRWVDGKYYMFYLERPSEKWWFQTHLTRSADLLNWEESPTNPILEPAPDENINNSDIDFTEFDGRMVIYYSWGSQRGDEHLAHARYDGTLEEWVRSCY